MNRPEPQNELQRDLLRLVWDLFSATAQWPKFREVDRLFRRTGEDALRVAHSLPAGLMEPPVRHPGEHPPSWFTVTLAGMIACTEPAQLDRSLFLSALRVAAEIDDEWEGFPEEPEAIPVLNAKELVVRLADEYNWNQLPEDPDLLLRRVALLLNREPVGMRGAVGLGEPGWQLSIEREIWNYRDVGDLDTYWQVRDRRAADVALVHPASSPPSPIAAHIPEASLMTPQQSPPTFYQVFVSSTYEDLKDERLAVTQALLKTERCIPAGMELFSASNDPAWGVVARALAYTDYLVLIIGNRAGSIVPGEAITYTEKEYEYALAHDIPVLAFLSSDEVMIKPGQQETKEKQRKALAAFKERVGDKTTERWSNADQLANQVTVALMKAFTNSPRPGWVRGGGTESGSTSPPVAEPVDPLQLALDNESQHYRITEIVQQQVEAVLGLDTLTATVNGGPNEIGPVHAEIQTAIDPLLTTIAFLAQRGDQDVDNRWIKAISQLSEMPRRDGSAVLINLARAPGALAFHTAGVAACIGHRDDLVGRLLGESIGIDDLYSGRLMPAATMLGPNVIYYNGWPSKRLHEFIVAFFAEHTIAGVTSIRRAWERWTFLYHTAIKCLALHNFPCGPVGNPYLLVMDVALNTVTEVGRRIIREVTQQGDSHDLFLGGLGFVGDADGFVECAELVDRQYGGEANRMDSEAMPAGGGLMPMSPHYPGVR